MMYSPVTKKGAAFAVHGKAAPGRPTAGAVGGSQDSGILYESVMFRLTGFFSGDNIAYTR